MEIWKYVRTYMVERYMLITRAETNIRFTWIFAWLHIPKKYLDVRTVNEFFLHILQLTTNFKVFQ